MLELARAGRPHRLHFGLEMTQIDNLDQHAAPRRAKLGFKLKLVAQNRYDFVRHYTAQARLS